MIQLNDYKSIVTLIYDYKGQFWSLLGNKKISVFSYEVLGQTGIIGNSSHTMMYFY